MLKLQKTKQIKLKKKTKKKKEVKEIQRTELPSMKMVIRTPKMREIDVSAKADTVEETKELMQYLLNKVKQIENWVTVIDRGVKPEFPFAEEE